MYQPLILRLVRYVNKKWFREETTEAPLQRKGRDKSQIFFFLVIYRGSKEGFQKDFTGVNRNFIRFDRIFLPSIQAQYIQNTGGHLKGMMKKHMAFWGYMIFRQTKGSFFSHTRGWVSPEFPSLQRPGADIQHGHGPTCATEKSCFFLGPFQSNSPKQLKPSGCFSVSPRCRWSPWTSPRRGLHPRRAKKRSCSRTMLSWSPARTNPPRRRRRPRCR